MKELLKKKTILVVGAGGLLGVVLAKRMLKQGANIIAADIDKHSLQERLLKSGVDINSNLLTLVSLDITNEVQVKQFFNEVDHLDGAVNATYPRNKAYGNRFFDVSFDNFNENVSLHLGSSFLFLQQCALFFENNKSPFSLVNISSIYGVIAPRFGIYDNTEMTMPVEYAAIKSALIHLTKYVSSFVNDSRFRVNCVSPGGIFDSQPKDFLEAYKEYTCGKGMLDVQDVIDPIIFLLSDNSNYVTAQNIIVDDGFSS